MTKGELTRARITGAAIEAFGKKGYFEVSLDEIARLAKVQRPAIINYFTNKIGLFAACVDAVMTEFGKEYSERSRADASAIERLDLSFEMNVELALKKSAHAKLIVLLYYGATVNSDLNTVYRTTLAGIRARYESHLKAAIREHTIDPNADTELLAVLLHETIMGMFINFIATGKTKDIPAMRVKWKKLKATLLSL
jgi:AcrR family transcriptional regulator